MYTPQVVWAEVTYRWEEEVFSARVEPVLPMGGLTRVVGGAESREVHKDRSPAPKTVCVSQTERVVSGRACRL